MADKVKEKNTREYEAYNPKPALGPSTWILDTIVIPIKVEPDASSR